MPHSLTLSGIDYAILIIYFGFVLGIGWALKRYMKGSTDFFLSGRSIPAWITGLAFLSANLGAQEVIGMAASGAKYGIMTSHCAGCMIQSTDHWRMATTTDIHHWHGFLHRLSIHGFTLHTKMLIHFGSPAHGAHRRIGVRQSKMATCGIKQVEIKIL